MSEEGRRTELADFLRTRRARLAPERAGLPRGDRRRTPGLRREEVALLADVGITLYTFLEQGRPIPVSAETLGRVARALQLDADETAHLFALAGRAPSLPSQEDVPANVRAMIDGLGPTPAYVVDACWDILAWNEAEAALVPAVAEMAPEERNALWLFFGRPERAWIVGWERHAREALAHFRLDYGRRRGDPRFAAVIERCWRASPEFRVWWARHDVEDRRTMRLDYAHPVAGPLAFTYAGFEYGSSLRLVVATPVAGTGTAERMARLMEMPSPPLVNSSSGPTAPHDSRLVSGAVREARHDE